MRTTKEIIYAIRKRIGTLEDDLSCIKNNTNRESVSCDWYINRIDELEGLLAWVKDDE